jgi:RNA polymerase-binding transcription factor DksA
MTKKVSPKKSTKLKKSPAPKAKDKESVPVKKKVGRPKKDATTADSTTKQKVEKPKELTQLNKANKEEVLDVIPKKRGRKPKSETKSDVEVKVREIVNKTKAKGLVVEEKKETLTFSLDDVRSILDQRKKESKVSKKKQKKDDDQPAELASVPKKKGRSSKVKKIHTASIDDILGFGVSAVPTRPIRDETKVPQEWQSYYDDLMSLRNSLKGALGARADETLGASARESSGELSINSSDSGTESFNRDVALSMVASEQDALEEIEDAIDRIFDGTFGICQETQKPIKKARLKVVPFTRFSLEGQTEYEQRNRKDRDSGGGVFATIADSTMGQDD